MLLRVRRQVRHGQTIGQREIIAHIRLAPPPHRRIDRQHQRAAPRRRRPPHPVECGPAILLNVDLQPFGPSATAATSSMTVVANVLITMIVPARAAARAVEHSPSLQAIR